MRLALIQLKVTKDKLANLQHASEKIREAVKEHKPRLVALPECFNSPYGTKYFPEYAETIPNGESAKTLSELAKELGVYIVGGSIPELGEDNKLYNTCTVWCPEGKLIAKHRKVHLYDTDVKGGIRFKESDTLSPGNQFTIIEIDGHKIGIGICYDIRFEEMAKLYRIEGCEMLMYPAAFNMTSGPLHWELLQRARANDNQLYVVTISPARDETADYVAYGNSMVVDPWAKVIKQAKEYEETIIADIDFSLVESVRQQITVFPQRRLDMYGTVKKI
ncbi:omega-amidase NIT2-like [Musca vetustissima]|nr:omega-amidase NIT2-like [Musca vetustissima]